MYFKVVTTAALVVVAVALPNHLPPQAPVNGYSLPVPPPPPAPAPIYGQPSPPPEPPAMYKLNWLVKDDKSSNDFGHQETRDGGHTEGSYYVLLADGRVQKVTYTVDGEGGYVAVVTYEGEVKPPTPVYTPAPPAPVYTAPTPAPVYAPPPPPVYG
ncbi:cuticle protein 7-like [Cherax quadricarinatus]|uniref:cuticle protein 7-like n=1 Tax=Cherax quadricarinatus TaxID=27406 RepID=UPI00387E55C7